MSSFFKNIKDAVEKAPKAIKHARDEVIGTWNPNRRHDEPHEIEQDKLRQEIRDGHRFKSFANERDNNFVKWHVDGHDYMWAISEMLDRAKEAIFILDWWLTPELHLRRPPAEHPEWRLDRVLKRKAEQGVKIYVIVYKEVTQTMTMSSKHTKRFLELQHPNICVLRHPDHVGSKDSVQFWSHHEKVVVVDNHYAAIGGLDLCFGRWDTHNHPLADVHPTDFSKTLFPGQDYNNARIMDFEHPYNYASNSLSILENPRMPWHDTHMTLTGPVVLDIVQHFVERWNEIKKRKYRNKEQVHWLSLPHDTEAAANEAVSRHPHLEQWREVGRKYKSRWHLSRDYWRGNDHDKDDHRHPEPNSSTCRVQVVRSVADWSHGYLTEDSIQQAYIEMIGEAKHFIYIENQFFITATKQGGQVTNQIGRALVDRIVKAARAREPFKVVVLIPELPGFAGNVKTETSLQYIMAGQYRSINRGGSSIYEEIRREGFEPMDYIRFYHLRAYDRINSPISTFIKQVEEKSGVKFHEAQIALARQLIGDCPTDQTEITLALPEALARAESESSNANNNNKGNKTTTSSSFTMPLSTEDEARQTVGKFERAAKEVMKEDYKVSDSVAQHMLSDLTTLRDEKWLGSEEEELRAYVSEQLYIHCKLMIVDDTRVIMGSANINDRSQKGDGDSEIALVVDDQDMIETTMAGRSVRVSRFAASLRRKLYREHLGLIPPQECATGREPVTSFMRCAPVPNQSELHEEADQLVADPICEEMWRMWNDTAKRNTQVFTELFRPVPSNLVRNWAGYENYLSKDKIGHVVEGVSLETVKSRLAEVRGSLVECPLDFLIEQKDFHEGPEWRGLNPTLPIYI